MVDVGSKLSDSKPLALFSRLLPALKRGLPTSTFYPEQPITLGYRPFPAGSELASSAPAGLSSSTTLPPRDHSLKEAERERRPKAPGGRDDDKREGRTLLLQWAPSLCSAHPLSSTRLSSSEAGDLPNRAPKFSRHHLKLSIPHAPSPRTGRAHPLTPKSEYPSTMPPALHHHSLSVTGPGPHGCSVAATTAAARPGPSITAATVDSPAAVPAPAQPGVPGPSRVGCACAARSGGVLLSA